MSVSCLGSLSIKALAPAIASVAYEVYSSRVPGETLSQEEVYKKLITEISAYHYKGAIAEQLRGVAETILSGDVSANDSIVHDAYNALGQTILYRNKISTVNKAKDIYQLSLPLLSPEQRADIYRSFLTEAPSRNIETPSVPGPDATNNIEAAVEQEPVEQVKRSDHVSMVAMLEDIIGIHNTKYVKPIIANLRDTVSKTWIDTEVSPEGTVKGYTDRRTIALTVEEKLRNNIYEYFTSRSNGTFNILGKDGKLRNYIFFNKDRTPKGLTAIKTSTDGDAVVSVHDNFKVISPSGEIQKVFFVQASDVDSAMNLAMQAEETVYSATEDSGSTAVDFMESSFTNPESLSEDDLKVFYSYIVTDKSNFPVFLEAHFPPLSKAYKARHRVAYDETGKISGEDQDSPSLTLHKIITPRLVVSKSGVITLDDTNPYLTAEDFSLVSNTLSTLADTVPEFIAGLKRAAETEKSDYRKGILHSIYYRYFSDSDYTVMTPGKAQEQTVYRSYARIVNTNKYTPMSVEEYSLLEDRAENNYSSNLSIEKALNALFMSMRSRVASEKTGSKDFRLFKTNFAGTGVNVSSVNDNFVADTTHIVNGRQVTKKYFFKDRKGERLKVSEVTSDDTKSRVFKIALFDPTSKEVRGKEKAELIYTIKVNLKSNSDGQTFSFKEAPVTIIDRSGNEDIPTEVIAKLFRSYGVPALLTSKGSFLDTLEASIKASETAIKNAANIGVRDLSNDRKADLSLENMYMNFLFTMLLNADPSEVPQAARIQSSLSDVKGEASAPSLRYNPIDTMYGYKEAISDMLTKTVGDKGRKYYRTRDGRTMSTQTSKSFMRMTEVIAAAVTPKSIHYNNPLTGKNRMYRVGPETFVKLGIEYKDTTKSVDKMSPHENSAFLMEAAFLQTAVKSSGFNTVLVQIGTQSDRLHPQLTEFTAISADDGIFILDNVSGIRQGGFSMKQWGTSEAGLASLALAVTPDIKQEVFHSDYLKVKSFATLQDFLAKYKIEYEALKHTPSTRHLVLSGRIRSDENGFAFVPKSAFTTKHGLDTHKLAYRGVQVQQQYYNNLNTLGAKAWADSIKTVFGISESLNTLSQVNDYLRTHPLSYKTLRAESGLVDAALIVKDKAGNAQIPDDILQSIALFESDNLAMEYMETMHSMFLKQMEAIGYNEVSKNTERNIAKVMGVSEVSPDAAKNILFDSYFYNAQILGNSALNLHTGGTAQYDVKATPPLLTVDKVFTDGKFDVNKTIAQANALEVPGTGGKLLFEVNYKDLEKLRNDSMQHGKLKQHSQMLNRLTYMRVILDNKKSFPDNESIAKALFFNDATYQLNEKFIGQVKRNQVQGSSLQLPRIINKSEPGFMLGENCNVVVVNDDKPLLRVIGKSGHDSVKATDGVQMVHPLYLIKLNNSLGNEESSFMFNGVAIKDLVIEIDEFGFGRIQKKASFGIFNNELLAKASPELYQLLSKMNTAIVFPSADMLVDVPGEPSWTNITEESWKQHGLSHGLIKVTEEDGSSKMVHASVILDRIKQDPTNAQQFINDLPTGKYQTAKQPMHFDSVQDLWEFFGAAESTSSWQKVADLIGNHSGAGTTSITLDDAVYPNRDAFIEKVGYTSQEKSGAKNTINYDDMMNADFAFVNPTNGNKRYSAISNRHSGIILQAEHNFDTTASHANVSGMEGEELEDNMVSLMTQVVSANVAEGISKAESTHITKTLNTLTLTALDDIRNSIVNKTIEKYPKLAEDKAELMKELKAEKARPQLIEGIREYTRALLENNLKTKTDPGLAAELTSIRYAASLTFDQKQLLPLMQSQIFSEFNKKAVKMKLRGGQNIVSPAHGFLPTYTLDSPAIGAKGKSVKIMRGLTRADMNKFFYEEGYAGLDAVMKPIVDRAYPMDRIKTLTGVTLSDKILTPDNEYLTFLQIKNRLRQLWNNTPELNTTSSFNQFLTSEILDKPYQYRFGNIKPENIEPLQWSTVYRYDKSTLEEINVLNTPEYKAYFLVKPIGEAYLKDASWGSVLSADDIPEGLSREYYFDTISTPELRNVPGTSPTTMISPDQEAKFQAWLQTQDKAVLAESVFNYIGKNYEEDSSYDRVLKKHLYNLLADEDLGWITRPTEVYLPHLQAEAFFLNTGVDGSKSDSLYDIRNIGRVPDPYKLKALGIITPEDLPNFISNPSKAIAEFYDNGRYAKLSDKDAKGRPTRVKSARQVVFDDYQNDVKADIMHMTDFFAPRVEEVYGINYQEKYGKRHEAANLFVFDTSNQAKFLVSLRNKLAGLTIGSAHYNAIAKLLSLVEEKIAGQNIKTKRLNFDALIDTVRGEFINKKVATLVDNFPKTLGFLMARVPGIGKQSATSGIIKNFIFSSKNSVYVPIELVLIAGLDYDIDKQSMVTWAVDKDGNVVDWNPYLVGGDISMDVLKTKIAEDSETVNSLFAKSLQEVDERIAKLTEQAVEAAGETQNEIEKKIAAQKNKQATLRDKLAKALANAEANNRAKFIEAGQNFILYNLTKTIEDPKNAIEANTPISMDQPSEAAKFNDLGNIATRKTSLEEILMEQQIISGVNPFSTIMYEKVTMDGKGGIGIYASDLKAMFASYFATISATADEQKHVTIASDVVLPPNHMEYFNITPNALQFFSAKKPTVGLSWAPEGSYFAGNKVSIDGRVYTALQDVPSGITKDNRESFDSYWKLEPNITVIERMANTKRWSPEEVETTDLVKTQLKLLRNTVDPAEQAAIIQEYIDKVGTFNSMNVEKQSWDGLSQLFQAAVDNAKELILGKIGANNTTNSIISTMIRLGVDLQAAVELINNVEIKKLVKVIEDSQDTIKKDKKLQDDLEQGTVPEEQFAEKLVDLLSEKLPTAPSSAAATPEAVFDYLTNPIRLLHSYAVAAMEFSATGKMLSINGGLKNSAYEVFGYIQSINDTFNKQIKAYNKLHVDDPIIKTFDMKIFVDNAVILNDKESSEEDRAAAQIVVSELLDTFDRIRVSPNSLFVLLKNELFFGYFTAHFQAKYVRDAVSTVYSAVESIIDIAKQDNGAKGLNQEIFDKIGDTVFEFGILHYLGNEMDTKGPIILRDIETSDGVRVSGVYDLRLAETDGKTMGRFEFIKNMPTILKTLEDNELQMALSADKSTLDPMTGIALQILKGPDLRKIPSNKLAELQVGLAKIKETDPALYKALFYYNLIILKGAYSGGSFVGLFPPDDYMEFASHLQKNGKRIAGFVDSNHELIKLRNPRLLPQERTVPINYANREVEDDDETDPGDQEAFTDMEGMPEGNYVHYSRRSNKKLYSMDLVHKRKRKDPMSIAPTFRSSTNSLPYQYVDELGLYVPLIQKLPGAGIPYTLDSLSFASLEGSGLEMGYPVTTPFTVTVKDASGNDIEKNADGHVLAYISGAMKRSKSSLSTKMKELLEQYPDALKDGTEYYLVSVNSKDGYALISLDELKNKNDGYVFDADKVLVASKVLDSVKTTDNSKKLLYYDDSTNKFYNSPTKTAPIESAISMTIESYSTGMVTVPYNEKEIEGLKASIDKSKGVDAMYDKVKVDYQFQMFKDKLLDAITMVTLGMSEAQAADLRSNLGLHKNTTNARAYETIAMQVNSKLKSTASTLDKMTILQSGEEGFRALFRSVQVITKDVPLTLDSIDFLDKKQIPQAALDLIEDADPLNVRSNISSMTAEEFKQFCRMIKAGDDAFETYIKTVFFKTRKVDALYMKDGSVYVSKNKLISFKKKETDLLNVVKSKTISLPSSMKFEYMRPLNKEMMFAICRHMNTKFPGVKWTAMNSAEIGRMYGEKHATAKAFLKGDGEIIINTDIATIETPFHEYGHVYLQYVKAENLEEYTRLMKLASEHVLYSTMEKLYGSEDAAEEVFVELLSMSARGQLTMNKDRKTQEILGTVSNTTGRFGKVINKIKQFIKQIFNIKEDIELSMTSSLSTVINKLSNEMLFGQGSMLTEFSEEAQAAAAYARVSPTITIKEARDILIKRGFIEWFCR
jgi:hypothetical protein